MATTTAADVANQTPELWGSLLLSEAENNTFFGKFEGPEGSSMPIIRKDDLTKESGDTIHTDMVLALTGAGIVGDTNSLSGNEEALKFRQNNFTVDDLSWAVAWTFKAAALMNYNMRRAALNQLQKWLAGKLDDAKWTELTGGGTTIPTGGTYFTGTGNTDVDGLAVTDLLTLDDITAIKTYAQATQKIEPIRIEGGEEYFGLVLDPWVAKGLKDSADYKQVAREAQIRGDSNPLFTGALLTYDGVIIYSNNRVPSDDNATSVRYGKNVFFGAQAMACGYAMYPTWTEEDQDYGRKLGVATTLIKGEKLSVFDLSAAGDGSGNRAIGSLVVYAAGPLPA